MRKRIRWRGEKERALLNRHHRFPLSASVLAERCSNGCVLASTDELMYLPIESKAILNERPLLRTKKERALNCFCRRRRRCDKGGKTRPQRRRPRLLLFLLLRMRPLPLSNVLPSRYRKKRGKTHPKNTIVQCSRRPRRRRRALRQDPLRRRGGRPRRRRVRPPPPQAAVHLPEKYLHPVRRQRRLHRRFSGGRPRRRRGSAPGRVRGPGRRVRCRRQGSQGSQRRRRGRPEGAHRPRVRGARGLRGREGDGGPRS